ncbi:MAG: hypothetical protein A2835_02960 [Candidatus Niyogibacteria bacterium RIFCSPHIGHO2_01_FULL_45_28]|uniref:Uncharacterized protein n=1 Tax=Candidatus Niyogibacteria bacterium RIFCSPLOWO2_02_FULL_45_13 TaxID=1801725 RepID=A0A1G2EZP9_9BACT|nr:MAG: hypothetical protein A2835_02960 [Candidatus Niyogibacteria bacterium RIFCSPHIGHO2_01_FULL_45_28]OGZ31314.1 MAG: hypothetical protein A3J00_02945 [Candidatus Niyogibacteria bacterium RIFCSPLOWO2_02_FULL_45_13]
MSKKLKEIQNKLNKYPISSLSKEEIELYFDHRLQNLLLSKKVLVRNELEYLLGETGPGNLRIEPDLFRLLVDKGSFVQSPFESIPEIKKLKTLKETAEKHIEKNINAPETKKLLMKILNNYIKKSGVVSKELFIIEGELNRVPVACLLKNGGWILPDAELFLFLKSSQKQKRFPIIIAKKISGILFPVFKGLSIMGLNTYKILLPEKSREIIDAVKSNEEMLRDLKYNNQFQFIGETTDECEPLNSFFEEILWDRLGAYYENFVQSKVKIADNFLDTVSQFRKNKATRGLIESCERKQKLLSELGS